MGLLDDMEKKTEIPDKKVVKEERKGEYGVQITVQEKKKAITAGTTTPYELLISNTGKMDDIVALKLNLICGTKEGDEGPEWKVMLCHGKEEKEVIGNSLDAEVGIESGKKKEVRLEVTAPRGARYGDRIDLIVTAASKNDPALSDSVTITTTARQAILAVKTAIGHERAVADSLASRTKTKDAGVFSILSPTTLRGYIIVETMSMDGLRSTIRGMQKVHGLVEGETTLGEIDHFLTPKPLVSGISEGDIVELIAGPFKGEKARVQQIDEAKEEITVELFEAVVPIPVTVRGDNVRVIEKE